MKTKTWYRIGDHVVDEDGNQGIVVIRWNDGDICEYENDAAHPNPERLTPRKAIFIVESLKKGE